ncbi:MAG: hypothetical protein WKG00_31770 [Polyangiaceae bacterium]
MPGQQIACACPGGFDSVQVCGPDSTFEACQCGYDSGSGAGGPGSGAGGPGSGAGGPGSGAGGPGSGGAGAGSGSTLASGSSPLIDVFVADAGIVIVEQDAVKLVDRGGVPSRAARGEERGGSSSPGRSRSSRGRSVARSS